MNINIRAKGFDLTPAITEHIENKMSYVQKLVQELDSLGSVSVDFEVGRSTSHHHKGDVFYAEANLHLPGKTLRADKTNEDLHRAIDEVKEVLTKLVNQYKEEL